MQSIEVQMMELSERVAALESVLPRTVNLGDRSNDPDVPGWRTLRMRQAGLQLQASLLSSIHRVAQMKMAGYGPQADKLHQLATEILEDWCSTPVPDRVPSRLHWSGLVEQLGLLAERYAPGSTLHDAAFDLCHGVLQGAQALSKHTQLPFSDQRTSFGSPSSAK
jgi:hypothetical protein